MRYTTDFSDYELIDVNGGMRLERWGDIILSRPDPQVIWSSGGKDPRWKSPHAVYHRSNSGGGHWEMLKKVPDVWSIKYDDLTFRLKPMGFKHTGLFPEQAVNWKLLKQLITKEQKPTKVLNLFAYTGGATLACLSAGAAVTHVDASKGMISWAKENAVASGLADRPVRWLVDDCLKFVQREVRRGSKYDGIVLDPPSYGRGPNGELWKLEQALPELMAEIVKILSDDARFIFLNTYTAGMSQTVLDYLLYELVVAKKGGFVQTQEIGLPVTCRDIIMPCGNTTIWTKEAL